MFVPLYLNSLQNDRSILAQMGLNTNACCMIKNKRYAVDLDKITSTLNTISHGIQHDELGAYYELIYSGYIKPYVFLRGIVRVTKNKFPPEKVRRELMADKEKKYALLQRIDLIKYQLAAAGTFYHFRSCQI